MKHATTPTRNAARAARPTSLTHAAMAVVARRINPPAVGADQPTPEVPARDLGILQRTLDVLGPVCEQYFRSEVRHLDRVPDGSALMVGNHDGGLLPVDAMCFAVGWYRHFPLDRPLRALMHEIPFHVTPALTRWLHGIGVVSARAAHFEALLDEGHSVLVYPGAAREAFRPFRQRRRVDLGGRSGFVVRALRRDLPIVPVASVGAHETFFVLARGSGIAHRLGVYRYFQADVWPLAVGLPWGLMFLPMLPYIPLPSKITVEVQRPIRLRDELSTHFHREIRSDDADDPEVVRAGFERVRESVERGVNRLYDERRYPVIG